MTSWKLQIVCAIAGAVSAVPAAQTQANISRQPTVRRYFQPLPCMQNLLKK